MDQQNIDRLFREKLDQLEVKPSTSAWSQVEKQIRPSKTPVIYWVAASISLLLVSWVVWGEAASEQQFTPIASEVNTPTQMDMPEFVIPEVKENKQKQKLKKLSGKSQAQSQFAVNNQVPKVEEQEQLPVVEIESKTMVALEEMEEPEIIEEVYEEPVKPAFRTVKITYIASSGSNAKEDIQKTDSTGVLKKFIAFAEKIDPGDMLADIKTAKDNLLNGGLKKKDKSSL